MVIVPHGNALYHPRPNIVPQTGPKVIGLVAVGHLSLKLIVFQGKNYTGAPGDFAPESLENHKRAPENHHRLQCKSLFNVAELVNGM